MSENQELKIKNRIPWMIHKIFRKQYVIGMITINNPSSDTSLTRYSRPALMQKKKYQEGDCKIMNTF